METRDTQKIIDRLDEQDEVLKSIQDTLKPISDTYTTFTVLGKWVMGLSLFISVIIGIILGILKLSNKK